MTARSKHMDLVQAADLIDQIVRNVDLTIIEIEAIRLVQEHAHDTGNAIAEELRRHAETYARLGREAGQQDGIDYRSVAADLRRRADALERRL